MSEYYCFYCSFDQINQYFWTLETSIKNIQTFDWKPGGVGHAHSGLVSLAAGVF